MLFGKELYYLIASGVVRLLVQIVKERRSFAAPQRTGNLRHVSALAVRCTNGSHAEILLKKSVDLKIQS